MAFAEGDPADRLPWKTAEYYHFAKNQELKELIRSFCVMQSMDCIVSDNVADIVNGKFSNVTPRQFWKDITNAYGLVWFFDGSMMYVYKSDEVSSSVYQMNRDEMRTLVKVISQLGFLSSNVTFRPLETAGILVVSGPPKLMALTEELSKKIVIERVSNVYDIRSFPLKHAWAYDMAVNYRGGNMNVPGVATMLQQVVGTLTGPVGDSSIGLQIDNSKTNEATATKAIHGTAYYTNESPKNSQEGKDQSKAPSKEGEKNPLNLGDIFVTFDTRLNAVIVKAKRQDMPFIESIIQQLDVPRDALKIEVAVVDISKSGSLKIRSQLTTNKRLASAATAANGGAGGTAATGGTERISFSFLDEARASLIMNFDKLFKNYSMAQTLSILENVGNGQTLIRSSVITLDNIGAVIDSSETAYLQVTGAKAGGLYDVTVSTKLVVVPHIIPGEFDANGMPKIKLLVEVTDGGFTKPPGVESTAPTTTTRTVNTEASVFEGQSLFIGGSFKEIHEVSSVGIPILKDIPLIGHLFKMSNRGNSVMERIYIITPTIIRSDEAKTTQLNRFFTESHLSGEPTLKPDEFILTHDYEKPSFEDATFKPKKLSLNWGEKNSEGAGDGGDSEMGRSERRRKRARFARRR
jgi:type III secretion protein C